MLVRLGDRNAWPLGERPSHLRSPIDNCRGSWVAYATMAKSNPPKDNGDLIDQIDAIREEFLRIQHSLEKMEPKKPGEPLDK